MISIIPGPWAQRARASRQARARAPLVTVHVSYSHGAPSMGVAWDAAGTRIVLAVLRERFANGRTVLGVQLRCETDADAHRLGVKRGMLFGVPVRVRGISDHQKQNT